VVLVDRAVLVRLDLQLQQIQAQVAVVAADQTTHRQMVPTVAAAAAVLFTFFGKVDL
jgi:hypothetical protein